MTARDRFGRDHGRQSQEGQIPACLVGHITVKDEALWQQSVAGVQESLIPFQASLVFRGQLAAVLAGRHAHDLVVVIEFHDRLTLMQWFNSDQYQALIPLRNQAADVVIATHRPQQAQLRACLQMHLPGISLCGSERGFPADSMTQGSTRWRFAKED